MELLEEKENSGFDIKRYLLKLLSNYPWIIIAVLLSLGSAKLYLRYQVSQYQVYTNILINAVELQDASNFLSGSGLLSGENSNNANVSNEIFIFQSFAL